ncbi:SubName: Full=Uncharacterized protein {ECO:0000313/EMBL:CCA70658.1} [Serendipita indica DSM 11827]|uniref:DUF1771 domain-containing protein n=1 Tax=Serendipita indica (strain DSM 11827) TaxID=1109443 RepID=G4TH65_SERID|nr:SubName: Full=Uncharacterized protein {ECO:0000313/EMBL:CCA70658.1} [Serendipita indica DSM 11827]CCA70658.1 hypothetical protein PIIN_04594 [Serendipita indica DSM 11827]
MSDAWDFAVCATIQLLRAGTSYLKVDPPYVLDAVAFALAILEGAILSNTLPDRRRLTLYPSLMLVFRIILDFVSSATTSNVFLGMAGTLGGLLLGPVFHSPYPADSVSDDGHKISSASSVGGLSTIRASSIGDAQTTPLSSPRRVFTPPRPVMHHVVDIDKESHRPVLFTPAMSLRTLPEDSQPAPSSMLSSSARSRTRVEDSFSTDETIKYRRASISLDEHIGPFSTPTPTHDETVYQDAIDTHTPGKNLVKETVRKLRAQAKNDDINRRNLLHEREQVLQEGDVARAFLLKHQAETLKKSMQESDKEAAKTIFEYYNPNGRPDKSRIDLRGLQASEAIQFCDEALKELQEVGGSELVVTLGRGKNTDGPGKGKVKPTLRQYAKAQAIQVRESDDGTTLILSLPTIRSPIYYD